MPEGAAEEGGTDGGDSGIRKGPRHRRVRVTPGSRLSERDLRDADDAALGAAVAARDQRALAEVYQRHGGTSLALARRILGDRVLAEEVVQEVFVRTWNDPDRYDPERGSLRSYLYAQVHGRAVDLLRAVNLRCAVDMDDFSPSRFCRAVQLPPPAT